MKKVFLMLALCFSTVGFAQILNVGSISKVNAPSSGDVKVAAIAPDGAYLMLTNGDNKGLVKYDLATSKATVLSTAPSAGFDVQISPDGSNVVYREASFDANHLRYVSLKSTNLTSMATTQLVASTRDLQGVSVVDGVAAVNKGKVSVKSFTGAKAVLSAPVFSIKNAQLMITRGGSTSTFSPNGTQYHYLWPSLSPDGTKVLYYVGGVGAFVCDLNGQNIKSIGFYRAPQWYNDNVVIAMNDKDNGYYQTSSSIVAVTLDGQSQVLTGSDVIAMYPYSTKAGDKIAFSTPEGGVYIINVNK
ncbi:MAG: hypothetical protein LKF31_05320 [Muribaculaceae bacterium]|nr:hypothetical protein [Muribaculaceae bacterium]